MTRQLPLKRATSVVLAATKKPEENASVHISKISAFGAGVIVAVVAAVLLALQRPTHIHVHSSISSGSSKDEIHSFQVKLEVPITPGETNSEFDVRHKDIVESLDETPSENTLPKLLQVAREQSSNLVAWMESHGLELSNSEIVTYDASASDRGMHATRDLRRGEKLLSVPDEFIITGEKARASPIGKLLEARLDELAATRHVYLALFLMEERSLGNQSWWHPFIETQPKSFRNMPMNFDEQEVALMEGSCVATMYENELEALREDYDLLCEKVPEIAKKFSFDDYKWGRLSVLTRAFSLQIDGKTDSAIMPFVDMFNHALDSNTRWSYNDEIKTMSFFTTDEIPQGKGLSISYGDKGNEELLFCYGFALPDNPNNEAVIYVGFRKNDPLKDKKVSLARNPASKLYRLFFKMSASPDHPSFQDALKMCRLAVATEADLKFLPKDGDHFPFSLDNERNALLLLKREVEEALFSFPQLQKSDANFLKDESLSTNHRNIILTRLGEKQVLLKIIDFVHSVLPLLQTGDIAAFNKARMQPQFRGFRGYLHQVARIYRGRTNES